MTAISGYCNRRQSNNLREIFQRRAFLSKALGVKPFLTHSQALTVAEPHSDGLLNCWRLIWCEKPKRVDGAGVRDVPEALGWRVGITVDG